MSVTNKSLKEIHQASTDDPSLVDVDWIMCDMITRILEIPGMRNAVIVAALEHDTDGGYVSVRNGEERMGDIPFQFVWNYLINPEELGGA